MFGALLVTMYILVPFVIAGWLADRYDERHPESVDHWNE